MDGETRRKRILQLLSEQTKPLSGTALAKQFGVSRQVIVQDIALLRATDRNILSTNKGYVLYHPEQEEERSRRILASHHDKERMQEELYLIVDNGGCVCDVVVEHEIYGQLSADLILKNRRDVNEFVKKMAEISDQPLNVLTGGIHFHTVEAESEEILDCIEEQLRERGF